MEKWKLARYLIDAKKGVDSIIFMSCHLSEIQGINVQKKVNECLREFYINCRTVFDNAYPQKGKRGERESLRKTDEVVQAILYEADKTHAHKDENYKAKHYDSLDEQTQILKLQLCHLRKLCSANLPEVLTLDFVPHDRELYRVINRIDIVEEEHINKVRHPFYGNIAGVPLRGPLKVYHDTEDEIDDDTEEYGVIIEDGLNDDEGLQNRQDACIKMNTLHDTNMWCQLNSDFYQSKL